MDRGICTLVFAATAALASCTLADLLYQAPGGPNPTTEVEVSTPHVPVEITWASSAQ